MKPAVWAALAAIALSGCAATPAPKFAASPANPEARPYAVVPNAASQVDAALARASANGKRVLLVMGANWCHDSRALAGWLETPRFAALVAERYELVFVNVGMPQSGDGHNLDIAQRFGLEEFPGTPAVLVLTKDGQLVNPDTAASWRNAATRSEDSIIAELTALASAPIGPETALDSTKSQHNQTSLTVWIAGDETNCRYAFLQSGPWFSDLSELSGLADSPAIDAQVTKGTDWKCVSKGIFELQKFGATLGFVSDPSS